jgi:hypothetical protein
MLGEKPLRHLVQADPPSPFTCRENEREMENAKWSCVDLKQGVMARVLQRLSSNVPLPLSLQVFIKAKQGIASKRSQPITDAKIESGPRAL